MAPEVIRGNYTHTCDLWSLGVMAYMLLSSQIPFVGRDMTEIAKEIMRCRYSFAGRRWQKISKQGKDFIDSLLVRDPSRRPNADQGDCFNLSSCNLISKCNILSYDQFLSSSLGFVVTSSPSTSMAKRSSIITSQRPSSSSFIRLRWLRIWNDKDGAVFIT